MKYGVGNHHATFKGEISGNPKPDGSVTIYCQEDETLVLNMGIALGRQVLHLREDVEI